MRVKLGSSYFLDIKHNYLPTYMGFLINKFVYMCLIRLDGNEFKWYITITYNRYAVEMQKYNLFNIYLEMDSYLKTG